MLQLFIDSLHLQGAAAILAIELDFDGADIVWRVRLGVVLVGLVRLLFDGVCSLAMWGRLDVLGVCVVRDSTLLPCSSLHIQLSHPAPIVLDFVCKLLKGSRAHCANDDSCNFGPLLASSCRVDSVSSGMGFSMFFNFPSCLRLLVNDPLPLKFHEQVKYFIVDLQLLLVWNGVHTR